MVRRMSSTLTCLKVARLEQVVEEIGDVVEFLRVNVSQRLLQVSEYLIALLIGNNVTDDEQQTDGRV